MWAYKGVNNMRRNCVYKYITKNQPKYLDIVVYEYGNSKQYCIHHMGNSCYATYDMDDWKPATNEELDMVWNKSNILSEYLQNDVIFLQVNWNK